MGLVALQDVGVLDDLDVTLSLGYVNAHLAIMAWAVGKV